MHGYAAVPREPFLPPIAATDGHLTSHPPARQSTPDQTRSRTMPPVTTNKHPWSRRNTPASAESCRLPTNRDPNDAFWPPDLSANSVHQLLRPLSDLQYTHAHAPSRTSAHSNVLHSDTRLLLSSVSIQFKDAACLPARWGAHCHWSPLPVNIASIFGHVCMDPY